MQWKFSGAADKRGLTQMKPGKNIFVRYLCTSAFICGFSLMLAGCADTNKQPTTRPLTMKEKQDAMLRDPMGYKDDDKYNISGGKINEFDKSAFKRDVDNVLNP